MRQLPRLLAAILLTSCSTTEPVGDSRDDSFTTNGKADGLSCTPQEAAAILEVANTASKATLKDDVTLVDKAITNILAYREGDDEQAGTADDESFGSLAELDAVPFIGPDAFQRLLAYVHAADLVPETAPRQWRSTSVANGDHADLTVAPDGVPVAVFRVGGVYKVRLPDGTQVDLPTDVTSSDFGTPVIAVDDRGDPHVFYQVGFFATEWKHASFRSGAWSQHVPITGDVLRVDQGPGGEIFALEVHRSTDVRTEFTLHTIAADGTSSAEPLWSGDWEAHSTKVDNGFHFNVDAGGLPSLVWRHWAGTIRNAWRTPVGWQTRDTGAQKLTHRTAVTTGGENAAVFVEPIATNVLRNFRVQGNTVVEHDKISLETKSHSMDAVIEPDGTAHVCMIEHGSLVHFQVDTTGHVTKQTIGSADMCWIGLDAAGGLHLMYTLGNVISHATYD